MEWLPFLFLGAFLFGLLFTILSVVLGLGHVSLGGHGPVLDGPHHGMHVPTTADGHGLHLDHGGSAQGHGGHGAAAHGETVGGQVAGRVSPWNITALMAFLSWFGGAGYLAVTGWAVAAWLAILLAAVFGFIGWWIVYAFFNRFLLRGEARMDPADYRLEGTVARVTVPLRTGRIGEIVYARGGSRHSEGARSLDGTPIERGAEVVIVRYEQGIAYVQPWEAFVGGEVREPRAEEGS